MQSRALERSPGLQQPGLRHPNGWTVRRMVQAPRLEYHSGVGKRKRMLDVILIALTLLIFTVFDRYTVALERL